MKRPVTIAVVSDHEVIYHGIAALLREHRDEVVLLERQEGPGPQVDVILLDVLADPSPQDALPERVTEIGAAVLAVISDLNPDLMQRVLAAGVDGIVHLSASTPELLRIVLAAADGNLDQNAPSAFHQHVMRLGASRGLSAREAEILGYITTGLSNQEIADRLFLSVNSVKTYIRTAYHKMGVQRRSQAVLWGLERGFPAELPETYERGVSGR